MMGIKREYHLTIDTPDGPMEVFLAQAEAIKPAPCAILYMDVFGLREELFDLARAFAADGISAVVPDLFHRLPVSRFSPANGRDEPVIDAAREANVQTTLQMSGDDTLSVVDWLDRNQAKQRPTHYFAIGYCMGGRHALAAAAAMPGRFIGGMSVHGGRLVTDGADSPHHLIATLRVPFHFACARDDATCPPEHCAILQEAAGKAEADVTVDIIDAPHGWSFPARWSHDPAVAAEIHDLARSMIRERQR
ncbi:MAG: dienelactone hydrolase family protein [Pseudomonadota bacterium]